MSDSLEVSVVKQRGLDAALRVRTSQVALLR